MLQPYREGDEPVPGYRLVAYLGRGAFGQVWRAASAGGGIEVALKVIDSLDPKQGGKELRALRLLKRIRHPNLVPLIAYWLKDEEGHLIEDHESSGELTATDTLGIANLSRRPVQLLVAMGLGEKSLYDRFEECQREGKPGIPADELLRYLEGAAKAIDALNTKHGIQHCDIKPQNILIVGGEAQVCDFGLAKAINAARQSSATAGTMAYSAPEIFTPRGASASTDQYCLAISYYELRTGALPFDSEEIHRVLDAKRSGDLNLSRVGPWERDVLLVATAVDPDARFPTAEEFVRELRGALESSEVTGASGTPIKRRSSHTLLQVPEQRTSVWTRRGLWLAALACFAAAGVWGFSSSGQRTIRGWLQGSPHESAAAEFAACLEARRYNDAAALLAAFPEEKQEELKRQLVQSWFAWLTQLVENQQVPDAMKACRDLVQRLPESPESNEGLRLLVGAGEASFQRGDVSGARALFETVLELAQNHPQKPADVVSNAELGVKLADVHQSGWETAATWLPQFAAGRERRSEWQRAYLSLLDGLTSPSDLSRVLTGLLTLKVEQPELAAKLSDPWARAQLDKLERTAKASVRDVMSRAGSGPPPETVDVARRIWPELLVELDLDEVEKLRAEGRFDEARQLLGRLKGESSTESIRRHVSEHELRMDLADDRVPFARFLERGSEVLAASQRPSNLLGDLYERLGQESAADQFAAMTLVRDYGTRIPVGLDDAERRSTSALCFRAQIFEPTHDFEALHRAGEEVRQSATRDPVVGVLLAESAVETGKGSAPEIAESLEQAAVELPVFFESYLKYVRVLRSGKVDRKADGEAIAALLNQPAAWQTPHRKNRLVELGALAASQLKWPTDADVLKLKNAFPDLRWARDSLPKEPAATDYPSQVRLVLTLLGLDQQQPLAESDLELGLPVAARLVADHVNQLKSSGQLLLVHLFLGRASLRRHVAAPNAPDRDAAIRSLAFVIRALFREQRPQEGVPDEELFRQVVAPAYQLVTAEAQNDLPAPVKSDAAFIAAAFGRIAQRTRVQTTADAAFAAYGLAVQLDPRATYIVGQARVLGDPGKYGTDEEKLAQLDELSKRLSPQADGQQPAVAGLRGMLYLNQSRTAKTPKERLDRLRQAMRELSTAVEAPPDERDEYYASYLAWQSSAHTEYANYYFRDPQLECGEIPEKETLVYYLVKAEEFARAATEYPLKRRPEDAWNALGNALEDHGFLLGQFGRYSEAIEAFERVASEGFADTVELGASYFHGGRCGYRWATAKTSADSFAIPNPDDRRDQLKKSLEALESAAESFSENKDRRYSEVCYWIAAASRELAPYLDEPDRPAAIANAEEHLDKAVNIARAAKLPVWSRWQCERIRHALLQANREQAESYWGELLEIAKSDIPFDPEYVTQAATLLSDEARKDTTAFVANFEQLLRRHSDAVGVLSKHPLDRIKVELRAAGDILRLFNEGTYGGVKNDKQLSARYLERYKSDRALCKQLLDRALAGSKSVAETERPSLQWQILFSQGRFADYSGNFQEAVEKFEQAVQLAEQDLSGSARNELARVRNGELVATDCVAIQDHLSKTWGLRFQMAGLCRALYSAKEVGELEKQGYMKRAKWVALPLLVTQLKDSESQRKKELLSLEREIRRIEKDGRQE